jgi:hypothetical protein
MIQRFFWTFAFTKLTFKRLQTSLWPKLEPFLEVTCDKIMVQNQYQCPYETRLLLVLYQLAHPRRIRPKLEAYFSMQKVKNFGPHINLYGCPL